MRPNRRRSSEDRESPSPEPAKPCKANCQFYGLKKFQGYCSQCFKKQVIADVQKPDKRAVKRKLSDSSPKQNRPVAVVVRNNVPTGTTSSVTTTTAGLGPKAALSSSVVAAPLDNSSNDDSLLRNLIETMSDADEENPDSDMEVGEEKEIIEMELDEQLKQAPPPNATVSQLPVVMAKVPDKSRCRICKKSIAHIGKFVHGFN